MAEETSKNITAMEVQRYLQTISDILCDQITDINAFYDTPETKDKFSLATSTQFDSVNSSNKILPLDEEKEKALLKNHEALFTDTYTEIPTTYFNDRDNGNPFDMDYYVKTYITFLGGNIENPSLLKFDVDDFNKKESGVFIESINIINNTTSTAESGYNYKITLKLNFTTFEDLYNEFRVGEVGFIPLNLVYPFAAVPNLHNEFKDLINPLGMLVQQVLHIKVDGVEKQIYRNFHVSNALHQFDIFKNDNPINTPYENELKIEYFAYETNDQEHVGNLKTNINIFKLLNNEELYTEDVKTVLKKNIDSYNEIIKTKPPVVKKNDEEERGPDDTREEAPPAEPDSGEETPEQEKYNNLLYESKTLFAWLVLNNVNLYSIEVPDQAWSEYRKLTLTEIIKNQFQLTLEEVGLATAESIGFEAAKFGIKRFAQAFIFDAGAAMVEGGIATATAGTGAALSEFILPVVVGAAIGLVLGKIPDIYDAYQQQEEKDGGRMKSTALWDIREGAASYTKKWYGKGKYISKTIGKSITPQKVYSSSISSTQPTATTPPADSAPAPDAVPSVDSASVELRNEDSTGSQEVYFTTLGDLLSIVYYIKTKTKDGPAKLELENLRMLIGGYLLDVADEKPDFSAGRFLYQNSRDALNIKQKFINFANIPIYMSSLAKILKDKILDDESVKLQFMFKRFINVCIKEIIQGFLLEHDSKSTNGIKKISPRTTRFTNVISKKFIPDQDGKYRSLSLTTNLATTADDYLKQFLNNKDINDKNKKDQKLIKTLKIFSIIHSAEYQNYFQKYNGKDYNSFNFQKFIHKEFEIPCILSKRVSNRESILKAKYIKFSRVDDKDMEVSLFRKEGTVFRKPYKMSAEMRYFMSFFIDIGSKVFIAPPIGAGTFIENTFGFAGLYSITSYEHEYKFQRIQDGKLTLPNFESSCRIQGTCQNPGQPVKNSEANAPAGLTTAPTAPQQQTETRPLDTFVQ